MVKVVVGLNWGDEGKGRMVDYFARQADCVIRYQGGDNAGHTVINSHGKFAFHNFPSGICYPNVLNIIGPGSVVNPESFHHEVQDLEEKGLNPKNIIISDRAHLILPFHPLLDKLEDIRLKEKKYGSTMSGIAPVYGDKYMKKGIQAGELLYPDYLKEHLESIIEYNNLRIKNIYGEKPLNFDQIYEWLLTFGEKLKPYIKDIQPVITRMIEQGKEVILEAQLGALRDITHGIYPYTTSSSTLAGFACASIPINPQVLKQIIGITKAYSTSVGEGAFVTEIHTPLADEIRKIGNEFGAKTGRPRRIGHFDAVATRYGCRLQGATIMTLTCLDVLSGFDELKICHKYDIDGRQIEDFPLYPGLIKAKPIYETLSGWKENITEIRRYDQLPINAKRYIERIEELCGVKIKYISVGPDREALIVREDIY